MYSALKTIVAMSIVIKICEFMMPGGNMNKMLKTVDGMVFLAVITECIINLFGR